VKGIKEESGDRRLACFERFLYEKEKYLFDFLTNSLNNADVLLSN